MNEKKVVWGCTEVVGLRCVLDGKKGCISPCVAKLIDLVKATKYLISLPKVRGKWIETILGHWVWFIMLRRPVFSVLSNVYRFLASVKEEELSDAWLSVNREFRLLICPSDMIMLDWRRKKCDWVFASDASLLGAGGCVAKCNGYVWYDCAWGEAKLLQPEEGVNASAWLLVVSWQWRFQERINVLVARAVILALNWILERGVSKGEKITFLVDKVVVQGAVRKGRSFLYGINVQLRRLAALSMSLNLMVFMTWILSHLNPADALSRDLIGSRCFEVLESTSNYRFEEIHD